MMFGSPTINEHFESRVLNGNLWTPSYLPAWSSLHESAATYSLAQDGLHLTIPGNQRLWCPDTHQGPLRVSAVQSGNWSGPVGSTSGQQPFRPDLTVKQAQPTRWGFTPLHGHIEVECRASLTPQSMFSAWMVGLETEPDWSGEICIVEVFGDTLATDGDDKSIAAIGSGIHKFRDPHLKEEFSAELRQIDVSAFHTYAVDWNEDRVEFLVDGMVVKTARQSPRYPMFLILGLFDFPAHPLADNDQYLTPELVVRRVET